MVQPDYVAIDLTSCSPATDEDYTLELWFKGSKPGAGKQATLFSTHADGVMAAFNAQGQLQLSQNDQMLATGTADCLDNQWHHFALTCCTTARQLYMLTVTMWHNLHPVPRSACRATA